jgi:Cys-rich protein (TIGR01571 family)
MSSVTRRSFDFNSHLYDCTVDCPSCMEGAFCFWCQLSAQYNLLTRNVPRVDVRIVLPLLLFQLPFFGLFTSCFAVYVRSLARKHLQLSDESSCDGCLQAFWCTPCSTCQVYRELVVRNKWPGGVCVRPPPFVTMNEELFLCDASISTSAARTSPVASPTQHLRSSDVAFDNRFVGYPMQAHDVAQPVTSFSQLQLPRQSSVYSPPPQAAARELPSTAPLWGPVYGYEGQTPQYGPQRKNVE